MAIPNWISRAARWTAIGTLALVVAVAAAFALLHTRAGLDFAAEHASRALSDGQTTVRIEGLSGSVASSLQLSKITLADGKGVFAEVKNARLDWRPWSLFGGTLVINALTAERISLQRLPKSQQKPRSGGGPLVLPFGLRAQHVAAEEISLGSEVFGEAQRLTAAASLTVLPDPARARIVAKLTRIDGAPDKAEVELEYSARPARFTARIAIEEPTGGLLARLAGLPRGTPLSVTLNGDGPSNAWKGRFQASAGSTIRASSAVEIALQGPGLALGIDGTARIAPLLPEKARPFATPELRLRANLGVTPGETVEISMFSVESAAAALSGSGTYGIADGTLKGAFALKTKDAALAGLVPDLSVSRIEAIGKIGGTEAAPEVALSLTTGNVAYGPVKAGASKGTIALKRLSGGATTIDGTLQLRGLDPGTTLPAGITGQTAGLSAKGTLRPDGGIQGVEITASSGPAQFKAAASLDSEGKAQGNYALALAEIAPLAQDAGIPAKGRLAAEGAFTATLTIPTVTATLAGGLSQLRDGPPWVAAVIGDRIPVEGTLDWRAGAPLRLTGFTLKPAGGTLTAGGTIDFARDTIDLKADVAVPALARFSKLAGAKLEGALNLDAALSGSIAAPQARGQANLSKLTVDGTLIGSLGAGYSARQDGNGFALDLRLGGTLLRKPVDGNVQTRFTDGRIGLKAIDLTLAGNRVTGDLVFTPESNRLGGALKASITNIEALPGAEEIGLTGSIDAEISLDPDGTGKVDITAVARNLNRAGSAPLPVKIGRVEAKIRLQDPFKERKLSGEVTIDALPRHGKKPATARLSFNGGFAALEWAAAVESPRPYPGTLKAKGSLQLADGATRLGIETLEGTYEKQPIKLQSPMAANFGAGGWHAGPFDLTFGGGRLRMRASMSDQGIEGQGRLESFPLKLAALIDDRAAIDGTLSGRFQARGPIAAPQIELSLKTEGIRPLDSDKARFPALTARLTLKQESGTTRAEATLKGAKGIDLTARVTTGPLVGGTDTGPLDGTVDARLRLAPVAELVGLGNDRVAGDLRGDLKLTGTMARPIIRGDIRLTGGSYEGAATGTILRAVEARATLDGKEVRLISLSADDGESGRITGKGSLRLSGKNGSEASLALALDKFTALRHPQAEIQASGTVGLTGSLEAPRIEGKLTINKGEIRIPDRLAEDIVELDVVEVNGPPRPGMATATPAEPSLAKTLAIALDVSIDVPNRTFVRGRGLDSEWKGKLNVTGTTAKPIIKGKLDAVRGTFAFAGKTFFVRRGTVAFPPGGGAGAEPEISAMAETKLTGLIARVEISGTISKPSLSVSSDPPLPQEDVLAQILFGKTSGQLTALQAAQLVQTAANLSGKVGGPGIVDKVRTAVGVDVLSVESGEGDSSGASLKAGNYLTEDLFLSVTQGTQPGSQKVGVEVQVTPNVTVESNVSGNADSNIGVNWKWDY
jgi:translocation and assembly module TamB